MTALPMDPSMLPQSMQMPQLPDYGQGINAALQANATKPKAGMFGGGGKFGLKEALAFGLAGLVSRKNPIPLQMMMGVMQHKQDSQTQEDQYQRQRNDQMQDWLAKQRWGLQHPESRAPHYFESNSGDQYTIGPDGKPQEVFHDPMRYKFVPNGMGGVVPVDIGTLMGGGQMGAPAPQGVTFTPMDGGPTPKASGGFPY